MKGDDLPQLEADVLAIVRAEREIPAPAPDVKARMFAAVGTRILVDPPPSGGGGGGAAGGARAPSLSLSGWRVPAAIAAAFLLGFATNAAWSKAARVDVEIVDPQTRPTGGPPRAAVTVSAAASAPVVGSANVPAYAASALPDAPAPPPSAARAELMEPDNKGLAGERALLDVARTALANGDNVRALAAVARHESAYPSGLLVEEREAMAVKALVAAGRNDEARARGARYAKRFPSGLMRPAVDGALRSIPETP